MQGENLNIPISTITDPSKVIDYHTKGKNVYVKDMGYDQNGYPVCLYLTSNGHEPGPKNGPYEWRVTAWNGTHWNTKVVCSSDHNYDMGSLYLDGDAWYIAGPTEPGPQAYGVGGELALWVSKDRGIHWEKERYLTKDSKYNHAYLRRPIAAKAPFSFFWANGDAHNPSSSNLFFGDFNGTVYQLPYKMTKDWETPKLLYSARSGQ